MHFGVVGGPHGGVKPVLQGPTRVQECILVLGLKPLAAVVHRSSHVRFIELSWGVTIGTKPCAEAGQELPPKQRHLAQCYNQIGEGGRGKECSPVDRAGNFLSTE